LLPAAVAVTEFSLNVEFVIDRVALWPALYAIAPPSEADPAVVPARLAAKVLPVDDQRRTVAAVELDRSPTATARAPRDIALEGAVTGDERGALPTARRE